MDTTPLGIRYPEPGDPPDIALYLKNLADDADDLITDLAADTGWVTVPTNSGHTPISGNGPQVRRRGGVVYMRGGWVPTGSGTQTPGTIPAGFRPDRELFVIASGDTSARHASASIATNGDVIVTTASGALRWGFTETWLPA